MGYTVINHFKDLLDDDYSYNVGDKYPRDGYEASDARIAELSGSNNKQGRPLIEKDAEQVADDGKHTKRFTKRDSGRSED